MIPHLRRATKTSMRLMLYVGDVAYCELWLGGHELYVALSTFLGFKMAPQFWKRISTEARLLDQRVLQLLLTEFMQMGALLVFKGMHGLPYLDLEKYIGDENGAIP